MAGMIAGAYTASGQSAGQSSERTDSMMKTRELYDLDHTLAGQYLAGFEYPWQALEGIEALIWRLGRQLGDTYVERENGVWVHSTAAVAPSAFLGAPCIIGPRTEVRHCAFIRGAALVGEGCVVGNSVELKNAILFDGVQVPHFNYVGDSILGYLSHLGAGTVTSNFKSDASLVVIRNGEEQIPTGLQKVGAMVGDRVEVGCNSVLNPGTVIGKNTTIYPTSCIRGVIPADSIRKLDGTLVRKEKR